MSPAEAEAPIADFEDATDEIEIVDLPAEALIELQEEQVGPQRKRLGEILVEAGLVDEDQLQQALVHQAAHGGRLGSVLVALGFLSEEQLESNLSQQLGIMVREVESIDPSPRVLGMVPEAMMRKHEAIPLRLEGRDLVVGMVDPTNQLAIDELIFVSGGRDVRVEMITEATFRRFVNARFTSDAFRETGLLEDFEIVVAEDDAFAEGAGTWEAVHLADFILDNAVKRRASDIHIEPYESFFRVRVRVDGALYNLLTPPQTAHSPLISRYKIMADMDISERRKPQDGQIRREIGDETIDFRVSTLPTVYGEKCVIRLLKKEAHLADLARLGFRPDQLDLVTKVSRKPQGMVLVTGPTGSGKTTTLHAIINAINEPDVNIVTLEDPVESAIPGVNHVAIKEKGGVGFAEGLRSILRQDPDVVFVGEMRDTEVSRIAIKASLTGHLVLSTLHTNGVVETFGRLLDMGIDPYLLANSVELVLAQRLLRRVCPKCSTPFEITEEIIEEFGLTPEQVETAAARAPRGCKACLKTGYKGRVAVYESLSPTPEVRKVLREGGDEQAILELSQQMGMVTMWEAGIARALAGETTFDEVRRRVGRRSQ